MQIPNTEQIPEDYPTNLSVEEASRLTGIPMDTIYSRLARGWSKREAFYRKVRYTKRNPRPFDEKKYEKVGEIVDRQVENEYFVKN